MPAFLRDRSTHAAVSNTELFFDLVYVFAITQLSVRLVEHPTWANAGQTALLLALVWTAWVYTTWVTNWLDPDQSANRAMLMVVMLGSLVMSAGLPQALGNHDGPDRGLWVAGAWASMQIGRTLYVVWATRGDRLQANFLRILSWCAISGALVLIGGFVDGPARVWWWLGAVVLDAVGGGILRFWTPWLGASETSEWTIDGGHFAERCQLFMIIALGESVVAVGASLAGAEEVDALLAFAFVGAFIGVVALFWLYFDRSAEAGLEAMRASTDPGKLAATAYHYVHPLMVAGIILTAAGDETVLHDPSHLATAATAWFVVGGSALFLLGHALYLRLIGRAQVLPHLVAAALLVLLAILGSHLTALTVGVTTLVILVALLTVDYAVERRRSGAGLLVRSPGDAR